MAEQVQLACPARLLGFLSPRSGDPRSLRPLLHFECGHVVPKEQVAVFVAGKGPSGRLLELRHNTRSLPEVMDEVGRMLTNVCNGCPDGVVAFFPSFTYLEQLVQRWASTGTLAAMEAKKRVFKEPRAASDVEVVLQQYAEAIEPRASSTAQHHQPSHSRSQQQQRAGLGGAQHAAPAPAACSKANGGSVASEVQGPRRQTGALLLAVVGGKLSEGINFGDKLGRCVVVVGMPYANPSEPELCQRMAYWDAQAAQAKASGRASLTGQQLYEAMCMNAVNQCVGRVVRHASDHAAIVLADARYLGSGSPVRKLPGWLQQSLSSEEVTGFGYVYSRLCAFFRGQQQRQQVQQ